MARIKYYDKTTHEWVHADVAGGGGGGGGFLLVTGTLDNSGEVGTFDKTISEIYEAYQAGKTVVAMFPLLFVGNLGAPINLIIDSENHNTYPAIVFSATFNAGVGTFGTANDFYTLSAMMQSGDNPDDTNFTFSFTGPNHLVPSIDYSDRNKLLAVDSDGEGVTFINNPMPSIPSTNNLRTLRLVNGQPIYRSLNDGQDPSDISFTVNITGSLANGFTTNAKAADIIAAFEDEKHLFAFITGLLTYPVKCDLMVTSYKYNGQQYDIALATPLMDGGSFVAYGDIRATSPSSSSSGMTVTLVPLTKYTP